MFLVEYAKSNKKVYGERYVLSLARLFWFSFLLCFFGVLACGNVETSGEFTTSSDASFVGGRTSCREIWPRCNGNFEAGDDKSLRYTFYLSSTSSENLGCKRVCSSIIVKNCQIDYEKFEGGIQSTCKEGEVDPNTGFKQFHCIVTETMCSTTP